MLINEVMNITGLSKKAIRFYENKGLLCVKRLENGYRVYSEENITDLKKIKFLRSCGVSVTDIKLFFSDIITIDELLKRRKKEIENEYGRYSAILSDVSDAFENYQKEEYDLKTPFDESADAISFSEELILGIDIGSTTISAAVIDLENPAHTETYCIPNNSAILSPRGNRCEQNPEIIFSEIAKLLELIISSYPKIKTIGITGQMHGILYTDGNGNAVSPLYTWQDMRADEEFEPNITYCDKIFDLTGRKIYPGFGFATHFYNTKNKLIPESACCFCSIMDYIVMKLTNTSSPLIHTSVAASFGLFDIKTSSFDFAALEKAGINNISLPQVTADYAICGKYNSYPVSVAIGDNQASFIGSVKNLDNSMLVNIGTGSQISYISESNGEENGLEIRPLVKDKFISCGSALCGGKSYALLENFFRTYIEAALPDATSQYTVLNKLAEETFKQGKTPIDVNTTFCGKRGNPDLLGSISGISPENFTPGQLILGFIYGICRELYDFTDKTDLKKIIVASGNAVRKIPVMKNVLEDVFAVPVQLSCVKEEAAAGAAIFSVAAAGYFADIYEIVSFLNHEKE